MGAGGYTVAVSTPGRQRGRRHALGARGVPAPEAASLRSAARAPRPRPPRAPPPRVTFPLPGSPGSGAAAMGTSRRPQRHPAPPRAEAPPPARPRPAPRAGRHLRERFRVSAAAAPARAVSFVPRTRHPFPRSGSPRPESRRRARRRARGATPPSGSRRGTGGAAPRHGASPHAGPRLPPQPPFLTAARALVPACPAAGGARGPGAGAPPPLCPARGPCGGRARPEVGLHPLAVRVPYVSFVLPARGRTPGAPGDSTRRRSRPAPGAGLARVLLPRPCHPLPPSVPLLRGFKTAPFGSLKETGDKMEGGARY